MKNLILDAGSGHNPHPNANILCDLFVGPTRHRGSFSHVSAKRNHPFVCCDIQYLPFKTNIFDFVYSSHVVEHVDNPNRAIREIKRVGKHGRISTPRGLWAHFTSNPGHLWVINSHGKHKSLTKGLLGAAVHVIAWFFRKNYRIKLRQRTIDIGERILKRDIHESIIKW